MSTKTNFMRATYGMVIVALVFLATGSALAEEPAPPRIYAGLTDDSIRYEFTTPNALVTFSLYSSQGGELLSEITKKADETGFVWISIWEHRQELTPGTFIVVGDENHTNELVVEEVSIDLINADENILSGKAPAGSFIWVVANNEPDRCGVSKEAAPDNTWQFDFDDLGCEIAADMMFYAQVMDDEGDTSEANPDFIDGWHGGAEGVGHPNSCNVTGFATDTDDRDRDLDIRVLSDGSEIASTLATGFWDGFIGECGKDGTCGFYINLWGLEGFSLYQQHEITVQAYDVETEQWQNLGGTPRLLTCANYDIYIFDTKTGKAERLTINLPNTGEYNPSWSPDGKKIVHDVASAELNTLYITDVNTHVSAPLPGADGGNDAVWSPNGKWIVFDRRWNDDPNLYILPPTGGTPKPVVSNAVNGNWSPDSQRLVFERDGGLWTASVKGGDEEQIVTPGNNPTWSPNGMWIVYDLDGDVYKVRVNKDGTRNGDPIQLTSGPASDGGAIWSQDSKQIVFSSDISGDHDIWQISAGGGSPVRLVRTNIYGDYDPGYNNTGQYIAYDGAKEPAQPYIVAFPEWGYIEAQDWPMNDVVHLMIDDPATEIKPDYEAEQPTVANDWGTWWVQFNFDYDLKIGDRVTETDGYLTRTYTVRNLTVRGASEQADLVTGSADPGDVVYVWAWDSVESYRELITGPDGTWIADYSAVDFNLEIGMCGRAEVRDKIGNRTAVDWCVRNPRLVASGSGNWFWTTDFFPGMLDISIYESADENAPLLWHGQREADQGGFVIVDDHGVDLVEGNYLVISDGVNHKELVVRPISINVFDTWGEAMAGTAPAGSEVWAAAGPQEWQERIQVKTDPTSGAWLADFTTIGFDITEEMRPWSYVHLYDEDGDANEGSTPPSARIVVQITDDWFRAENFTPYGELAFWVYDAEENLLRHPEQTWPLDEAGYTTISMWELDEFLDLVPGYHVVIGDGSFTKDIVLEAFTFDTFDLTTGQLSGTAPAPSGRAIWTGIGWQDQAAWLRYVTSDGNGVWHADFGQPISSEYWWVAVQVFDADGDASELRPAEIIP